MEVEELIAILLGRRYFYKQKDIIDTTRNSKHYNSQVENLSQVEALKFFQTSKQRTWLVSTNERMYCILDDNRKEIPHIRWSIPKNNLIYDNKVSIEIKTQNYSEKSGLIDIGQIHNWLYSQKIC
jgi:hypothetical protein